MSLYAEDDRDEPRFRDGEERSDDSDRCECGELACAYDRESDRLLCVDCRGDARVRLDASLRHEP